MSKEHRETLVSTASSWDYDGDGNCIVCVTETIETLIDVGASGETVKQGEEVNNVLKVARESDISMNEDFIAHEHNVADLALQLRREQPHYKLEGGILKQIDMLIQKNEAQE